jgi:hypothetical protein
MYQSEIRYFRAMRSRAVFFFFITLIIHNLHAQDAVPRKHSPKTATLLSLALPGAGQIYNRKNWWWKVPIIYGGGGIMLYGANFYHKNYVAFNNAYAYRIKNNVDENGDIRFDRYQTQTLGGIRSSYRQARDEMVIGLVLLYALQVVDAAVEAHFFDFNINDDLSLNIQPSIIPAGTMASAGIQLNLKLNKH